MIMSCLVFPMNCSPGVLRIEISYLAILTGILSSILFYLIFFFFMSGFDSLTPSCSRWRYSSPICFIQYFFFLLKEALAYDYITDSDGRCFIRIFVSKNFSEIGKKMNRKRSSIFLVIKQFSSTTHRLYHQFWWQVFQFELFCLKSYQELEKNHRKCSSIFLEIKIIFFWTSQLLELIFISIFFCSYFRMQGPHAHYSMKFHFLMSWHVIKTWNTLNLCISGEINYPQ